MRVPLYQIDAFTDELFRGNPAAVCPLDEWLADDLLQSIAAENNLSETAFFVPEGDGFQLRWFTPRAEVDLCGHATLASGWVVLRRLEPGRRSVRFRTRSGELRVDPADGLPWVAESESVAEGAPMLAMDFPA
ncbi:MAG: PhzF family phenazine biosynthesis protein, partial [Gemmatimonadota bacterium]